MAPDKGKSIFIGNIPFSMLKACAQAILILTALADMTEEEIVHLLSTAGTVTKFRLMTNPDTGKPKGFGFADFSDADSAASAVRNLNDHEIHGRKIRVDWPHNNEKDSVPQDYSQINNPNPNEMPMGQQAGGPPTLPPLPPGVDLPPNFKCADAISNTLKTLPPPQLLDILSQMKTLTMSDPETAKRLMKEAPQLAYAIFQALVLMNLVDPNVLATVVEQNMQAANNPQMSMQQQQQQPPPMPQPQPPQQYGYPPPPQMQNRTVPTPQQYPPPPMPQQAQMPPQQQGPPGMSPEQRQMLEQVMQLDQRTIDSLPLNERMQIMQLREQWRGMGVR
jgi:cleavage stimulation factor subunit 2